QDLRFRPRRIVLGQRSDLLEEPAAIFVIQPSRRQRFLRPGKSRDHVGTKLGEGSGGGGAVNFHAQSLRIERVPQVQTSLQDVQRGWLRTSGPLDSLSGRTSRTVAINCGSVGRFVSRVPMAQADIDLFVIGGGSGGLRAAWVAASHGARVV